MKKNEDFYKRKLKFFIEVILDPTARDHEKDDAAMDIVDEDLRFGWSSDKRVIDAIVHASLYPSEEDRTVRSQYGEAIGEIWAYNNIFDLDTYLKLPGTVRYGIYVSTRYYKSEWVDKYELKKYGFEDEDDIGKNPKKRKR